MRCFQRMPFFFTAMNYRLIIFDLDGTLVDSRDSIMAAMGDMAREMGLTQEQLSQRPIHIGLPMSDILRELGIQDIDAARAAYRNHYHKYTHMELAFPGVPELLEQLRGTVTLAIATNKAYEGSLRTLGNAGIRDYFDFIASLDQGLPKPDPDAFIRICAHYRGKGKEFLPEDCLMVGDSPIDLEFASRCGIDSAFAEWGFHEGADLTLQPGYFLTSPQDLMHMLL
ncbi:MAG: HAD family hydrolase [Deltaproteobacteria bacterium]|nr:HAD family hydrolase [Deltaproteobacteria bacterium]